MQMLFKVCCILMRKVEEAKVCWRDGLGPWVVCVCVWGGENEGGKGGGLGVHPTGFMDLELNLALPPILQMRKMRPTKGKGLAQDQRASQSHRP